MSHSGPGMAVRRAPVRHARSRAVAPDRPAGSPGGSTRPPGPYPPDAPAPPTLVLVISRRARREAAELAAAQQRRDPRIETVERVLAGFQIAGDLYVLALSLLGWLWLDSQQAKPRGSGTGAATGATSSGPDGIAGLHLLHPIISASGATLVLIMLATCLLMAPAVNPFYSPPADRRILHTVTTLLFGLLAMTTVAVITGAAR